MRKYYGLRVETNTREMPYGVQRLFRICLHLFLRVVGINPNTPNLSPTADDAITRGGIRGLESPL